ncbi:MAG: HAD-IC family P-type ATPase, partial [Minisyncoccia bacterium]
MITSVAFLPRRFGAFASIISRNVFVLVNGIIFAVAGLLIFFGSLQEGIFLGFVTTVNIIIGSIQEIGAWLTLDKLQLLAAPRTVRVATDGTESGVLAEEILEKDSIRLSMGDQVPCDGVLSSSHGFEVNEALITGESHAFLKKPGDAIFAGSIVTSGVGLLEVEKVFAESRIALMTKSVKKYSSTLSPIQYSITTLIRYIGYLLLFIIAMVVARGSLAHISTISIIRDVGALTSVLLPQGLVVIVTIFFSYGAYYLNKRNVLLQEVNATEKIGRIKNLCVDKTGTLTDNHLVIEQRNLAPGISDERATESVAAYIKGTGDASQTIKTIQKTLVGEYSGTVVDSLSFSSSRQFGVVKVIDSFGERVVAAGAPDLFIPYLKTLEERGWMQRYIDTEAKIGKRLICFVESASAVLPQNISELEASVIALFVLNNSLREGVKDAIHFFQERGVTVRVISGDNPATVQAVARAAGIMNVEDVISGSEMDGWTDADFSAKAHAYTIFARIKPEQKEKLVEALKRDGFTAMIGDGANDALAIKKADLGIAMFDGAPVTRKLAAIVLVKNSFADLPNGVRLADSIIQYIEMCASIFFNQVLAALFFFSIITAFGYSFPFMPLNITFINYFTTGLPTALIFYWIARPSV